MRAIHVRCPNCGASLTVDDGLSSVACQYCGTSSRIQPRSRVWQVPQQIPSEPGPPRPVARQRVNPAMLLIPILFVVTLIAVPIGFAVHKTSQAVTQATRQPAPAPPPRRGETPRASPPPRPDTWATGLPLVADVDGDGGDDLIGFTRNVQDGDRAQLAAFSGATGAQLWSGERLGTYSETVQASLYLAGELVLMSTPAGELRAFAAADGSPRWTASLGERITAACATSREPAVVRIGTNDRRWHTVTLADGGRVDATEPRRVVPRDRTRTSLAWVEGKLPAGTCLPLPFSGRDALPGLATVDSWSALPKIDGMTLARLIRRGDGPVVAVGRKSPGTGVPMLAVLDGRTTRWKAIVPHSDPLQARAEDEHITISADAVFQVWEGKDGPHLAAFELADGRRRWDVALDRAQARVVVGAVLVGTRVVVAGWGGLMAFETADGTLAYSLGG